MFMSLNPRFNVWWDRYNVAAQELRDSCSRQSKKLRRGINAQALVNHCFAEVPAELSGSTTMRCSHAGSASMSLSFAVLIFSKRTAATGCVM